MRLLFSAIALLGLVATTNAASAAALRAATFGCDNVADAQKLAVLQLKRDQKGADALSRPLIERRTCIDLPRGAKIEVEEKRAPMACVRLTGDLSCYWIDAGFVNENPDEKREGAPSSAGGRGSRAGHSSGGLGVDGIGR